jgi:hypothetical protein
MFSTYLVAFVAMAFSVCAILVIKTTVDRGWHLGE